MNKHMFLGELLDTVVRSILSISVGMIIKGLIVISIVAKSGKCSSDPRLPIQIFLKYFLRIYSSK